MQNHWGRCQGGRMGCLQKKELRFPWLGLLFPPSLCSSFSFSASSGHPCLEYNFLLLLFFSLLSSWFLLLLPWSCPGSVLIGPHNHLLLPDRSLSTSIPYSHGHISLVMSALMTTFPRILMAFGVKTNPGTL